MLLIKNKVKFKILKLNDKMAVRILAGMDSEQEGFIDLSTHHTQPIRVSNKLEPHSHNRRHKKLFSEKFSKFQCIFGRNYRKYHYLKTTIFKPSPYTDKTMVYSPKNFIFLTLMGKFTAPLYHHVRRPRRASYQLNSAYHGSSVSLIASPHGH